MINNHFIRSKNKFRILIILNFKEQQQLNDDSIQK